jgi:hypothetical protein
MRWRPDRVTRLTAHRPHPSRNRGTPPRTLPTRTRRLRVALAVGVIAALLLSGCFWDNRSVEAVCQVWDSDGLALHRQLTINHSQARQNPIGALAQIASAPGQLGDLMEKMAAVAPSDVEPSFQELANAFHQMAQNEGDPMAALASGLAGAFTTQGAANEVNSFLAQHCGIPGR